MLATPEAVHAVLFGPSGLAETLGGGQILIEMSTIGPKAFRSVAARLPDGVGAVDAPVRGSVPEATSGRLHVFVGATNDDFERVRPILESLGDVRHIGAPGSGAAMKLVLRHAAKDMRLVAEAAGAAGLDLKEARAACAWLDEALRHGAGELDYSAVVATILSTSPSQEVFGTLPNVSWRSS